MLMVQSNLYTQDSKTKDFKETQWITQSDFFLDTENDEFMQNNLL